MTVKVFLIMLLVSLTAMANGYAQSSPAGDNTAIIAQEIRNETRLDEERAGGFSWQSWPVASPQIVASIKKREPRFDIYFANTNTVDFVLADLDHNGNPDMIVYFWGACGSHGCPINIYFDMSQKPVGYYYGWTVQPYKEGVLLDDSYYQL